MDKTSVKIKSSDKSPTYQSFYCTEVFNFVSTQIEVGKIWTFLCQDFQASRNYIVTKFQLHIQHGEKTSTDEASGPFKCTSTEAALLNPPASPATSLCRQSQTHAPAPLWPGSSCSHLDFLMAVADPILRHKTILM